MLSILSYKLVSGDWNVTISYRDYRDCTDRLARFQLDGRTIHSLTDLTEAIGCLVAGLAGAQVLARRSGDGC